MADAAADTAAPEPGFSEIFDAVDGPGSEGNLIGEEGGDESPDSMVPDDLSSEPAEAKPIEPAADVESDEAAEPDPYKDIEELFSLGEETPEEEQADEVLSEDERKQFGERASERIVSLNNRLKEQTEQFGAQWQNAQAQYSQVYNQLTQANQFTQQLQTRLARLEGQLEAGQRYQPKEEVSAEDQLIDHIRGDVHDKVREALMPEMRQLKQEVQQLRQEKQQEQMLRQRQEREQQWNQDIDTALDSVMFPQGYPDELKNDVRGPLGDMLLMYQASRHGNPSASEVAQDLVHVLQKHSLGIAKAMIARKKGLVAKSQKTPPPTPAGKATSRNTTVPNDAMVKQMGAKDPLDAMFRKDFGGAW